MNKEDQEKIAFVTSQGLYCYRVMPFGLKNAGATYQRLVNQMFCRQIGRNMEVYVDDMLMKRKKLEQHLDDLRETFDILRKYQMRLNPAKCVFRVSFGKFLGFMVSQRGIKANPEKVKAILDMMSLRSVKEVQRLMGRIATLNSFMSRVTDKYLPFFKTLKQTFHWTDECEVAFQALKDYLSKPPLLSPSVQGEELFLYLAVSQIVVSLALIREELGSKASFLHKPSFPGGRSKILEDRKASLYLDCCIKEAPSLLLSTQDTGDDGPTIAKGHGQARCSRKNGLIGSRIELVRC